MSWKDTTDKPGLQEADPEWHEKVKLIDDNLLYGMMTSRLKVTSMDSGSNHLTHFSLWILYAEFVLVCFFEFWIHLLFYIISDFYTCVKQVQTQFLVLVVFWVDTCDWVDNDMQNCQDTTAGKQSDASKIWCYSSIGRSHKVENCQENTLGHQVLSWALSDFPQ